MRRISLVASVLLLVAASASAQPNILIIIADDLGLEHVEFNGVSNDPVSTPNLSDLAAGGLVLTNFWAAPLCSVTRAALLTGRQAHQTGVGFNVIGTAPLALELDEVTLPEHLSATYSTALFGKWHLGGSGTSPRDQGFDHFSGWLVSDNADWTTDTYSSWNHRENDSLETIEDGFLPQRVYDDATAWISSQEGPWLAVVADLLPHWPWICPPEDLIERNCREGHSDRRKFQRMIEAHDALVGQLLDQLPADTIVVWFSDNGSDVERIEAPVPAGRAKGTTWQGGVRVPAMISGPGLRIGIEDGPMSVHSLFATLSDLAGVEPPEGVELSVADCLSDGSGCGESILLTQAWKPLHSPYPPASGQIALRDGRYKLTAKKGSGLKMFDLMSDPWEQTALGRSANPEAWDSLLGRLQEWVAEWQALSESRPAAE